MCQVHDGTIHILKTKGWPGPKGSPSLYIVSQMNTSIVDIEPTTSVSCKGTSIDQMETQLIYSTTVLHPLTI